MVQLFKYPDNNETLSDEGVYMIFHNFRPKYNAAGVRVGQEAAKENSFVAALYLPLGYSVSDSFNYEPFDRFMANLIQGGMKAMGDLDSTSEEESINLGSDAIALARAYGDKIGQGAVALAGHALGSTAAGIVGMVAVGDVASQIQRGTDLWRGRIMNPKAYALFSAPNIRTFAFSFKFIPRSQKEADQVPQIIRAFRQAAVPKEIQTSIVEYALPDYFHVKITGTSQESGKGMIQMPELVCTSIQTTYNPNSLSFFRKNELPVEIDLVLNFQETKPITKEAIEEHSY